MGRKRGIRSVQLYYCKAEAGLCPTWRLQVAHLGFVCHIIQIKGPLDNLRHVEKLSD